jgi:fibronectin-binding autotransporter adhesin
MDGTLSRRTRLVAILALAVAGALASTDTAAAACPGGANTWNGSSGGNWSSGANWSAGVPAGGTTACIPSGTAVVNGLGGLGSVAASLTIEPGAGVVVQNDPSNNIGVLTVGATITNRGTITLTSTNLCGGCNPRVFASSIANTGTIASQVGDGGPREIGAGIDNQGTVTVNQSLSLTRTGATYTNSGAIDIAAGRSLTVGGGDNTHVFNLAAGGTIGNAGLFTQSGGAFRHIAGTATGNPLELRAVAIDASPTSGSAAFVALLDSTLTDDVAAADSITVTNDTSNNLGTLTAPAAVTNAGTISLSSRNLCGGCLSRLVVNGGTLVNTGTIVTDVGEGGPREIAAALDNRGALTLNQGASLTKTGATYASTGTIAIAPAKTLSIGGGDGSHVFSLDGGTLANAGTFTQTGGAFRHNAGTQTGNPLRLSAVAIDPSAASGTASLVALGQSSLTGDVAAGDMVTITNDASNAGGSLAAAPGLTNAGAIVLTSGGCACSPQLVVSSGTLTNAGTLTAEPGDGGPRRIAGSLANKGTFDVRAPVTFDQPGATLSQSAGTTNLASGALNLTGSSGVFTLAGGVLTGTSTLTGSVNNTGGEVRPGSSPGVLAITGNYTQGAGGTLRSEIAGTAVGTKYDRLAVTGTAALGGTLAIATTAFSPVIGQSFQVLTAGKRTGSFKTVTGSLLSPSRAYAVQYDGRSVTATVKALRKLSVKKAGSGTVTSAPAGIKCGSACSATFLDGARVKLTAKPSRGSAFAGWSGACKGSASSCRLSLTAARSATASFVVPTQVIQLPASKGCFRATTVRVAFRAPSGLRIKAVKVLVNGKPGPKAKKNAVVVDLRGRPAGRYTVKATLTLSTGKAITVQRTYRRCGTG